MGSPMRHIVGPTLSELRQRASAISGMRSSTISERPAELARATLSESLRETG
jgi:hypothetical protein